MQRHGIGKKAMSAGGSYVAERTCGGMALRGNAISACGNQVTTTSGGMARAW